MPRFIDLHTHTTASDGTDTPQMLLEKADEAGLCAVAITDHDTIDGLDEVKNHSFAVELVRGVEISVTESFGEFHLLGLFITEDEQKLEILRNSLLQARQKRNLRNQLIIDKLNMLDIPIRYEDVLEKTQSGAIGRPHIAKTLVEHGYVESLNEAFVKYLRYDAPAFVPKESMRPYDGIKVLKQIGALACIAHPILARCSRDMLERKIFEMKDYGLDAIEVYHAEFSQSDTEYLKNLAKRFDLQISGGTDYHGNTKPKVKLGRGKYNMYIPESILYDLKEYHAKLNT